MDCSRLRFRFFVARIGGKLNTKQERGSLQLPSCPAGCIFPGNLRFSVTALDPFFGGGVDEVLDSNCIETAAISESSSSEIKIGEV